MIGLGKTSFAQFVTEAQRRSPAAAGDLSQVLYDVVTAVKAVSAAVARGAAAGLHGAAGATNVQGEVQHRLDVVANEIFVRSCEWGGHLAGMASEELEGVCPIPAGYPRGEHLLAFDPLDGSSNVDVNISVGSIFSILRRPGGAGDASAADFLQPGTALLAAGYALYGPSTVLVLSLGSGVHGFTLDRELGHFVLTHPDLRVPPQAREFAINASNERFWEPPVRRYVQECLEGRAGPRQADFNMRWVASLVAEVHRILVRGGVFLYPRDSKEPARAGRLRLLYEAAPVAFLVEQAGGAASTGRERLLDVVPRELHQRVPLVLGSREEVERIVRYHDEHARGADQPFRSPLFGSRSLFSQP
jgi:fructose-1,6-bisphosphatase I/sedoheptulose-1,7-bisphosphatase/fructose-1,6-bisphosphatase I